MDNQVTATLHMFKRYRDVLVDKTFDGPDQTGSDHLRWMCETAIDALENETYPLDKMSRWLGFVQGVLIMQGITTVNTERDYSRPLFKPESTG
jgi:hypothetical protein